MIVAQGEWQNDGYRVSVWGGGGDDSRPGWLIDGYRELVWGGGFIVAWMADGYRVSMWNGDVSHLRG